MYNRGKGNTRALRKMRVHNRDEEKREDKIVLWRKITRALKDIYEPKSIVNKNKKNKTDKTVNQNKDTKDCENTPNPDGQGEVLPAPSEETCNRGREGLETHAVVAISARDMSVGAVIGDYPQ